MPLATRDLFYVHSEISFYRPTDKETRDKTGVEGTRIINPHPIIISTEDIVTGESREHMRKQWASDLADPDWQRQHVEVTGAFIRAGACPIPSRYAVELPVPAKFKNDPVYAELYWRGTNGPSFEDVVKGLIPFEGLRKKVLAMQKAMVVPMAYVDVSTKYCSSFTLATA